MGRKLLSPEERSARRREYNKKCHSDPVKHAQILAKRNAWRAANKERERIRQLHTYYRKVSKEYESCVYIVYSPSDPTWIKVGQTCQPSLRLRALRNTPRPCRVPRDSVFYYKQKVEKENRVKLEKEMKKFMRENYIAKSKDPRNEIFYVSEETEDIERIKMVLQDMAMAHEDQD